MMGFLKNLLFGNIPLKLIAVGLAFLVWYYIGQKITDRVELELSFKVVLPAEADWRIEGRNSWDVKVTLRGPHSDIQRIRALALTLVGTHRINPESLTTESDEAVHRVPVTREHFHLPFSSVQFSEFDPPAVDVRLVRVDEKSVPVIPVTEGEVAEGYVATGTPGITPRRVRVRGPVTVLRDLAAVKTWPVRLNGRAESFEEETRVQTRMNGHKIECEEEVRVRVTIEEQPVPRELKNIPVVPRLPADWPWGLYQFKPKYETLDVRVIGPQALVEKLEPAKLHVVAHVKSEKDWENLGESRDENTEKLEVDFSNLLTPAESARLKVEFLTLARDQLLYTLVRIKK